MKLLRLALKSAWSRRASLLLSMFSIALGVTLLVGVDTIRKETKSSFINTISQTDLIVGARSGPINLLLYSVFRIGNATNNVSWESYRQLSEWPDVEWAVPLSLGDSHRGFRVLGTSTDYFQHYRYAGDNTLQVENGAIFDDLYDAVIGSEVARSLNYKVGDKIVLAHGLVSTQFTAHDDKPFRISGVLQATGTPVDRTVHVSLEAIEAIHVDWQSGTRMPLHISAEQARKMDLQPKTITAFMLGLKNRIKTFRLQRSINQYREEPLLAIIPGATLASLWQTLGNFEQVLLAISALVLFASLIGMLTTLLSTLNERRREMAILRTVGAHPYQIIFLFILESLLIMMGAILLGLSMMYAGLALLAPYIQQLYGLQIAPGLPDTLQWGYLTLACVLSVLISLVPGIIAYRRSLQDGLSVQN